jgi:hypothetical protein
MLDNAIKSFGMVNTISKTALRAGSSHPVMDA